MAEFEIGDRVVSLDVTRTPGHVVGKVGKGSDATYAVRFRYFDDDSLCRPHEIEAPK